MAKRPVPLYDFAAFGQAIKAARTARKESRKDVSDAMNISPRYLTNIENKGQQPSLQIFYELVTRYNISVDQFFFPNRDTEKSTQRRQLDTLLDNISDKGLRIVTATAKEVAEIENSDKLAVRTQLNMTERNVATFTGLQRFFLCSLWQNKPFVCNI